MKIFVVLLAVAVAVLGHGGMNGPQPLTEACSATSDSDACGAGGSPCGPGNSVSNPTSVMTVQPGDKIDVGFFQLFSHSPGANYYEIFFWENDATEGKSLLMNDQSNTGNNVQLNFTVTIPEDVKIGQGLIQFVYNCTAGGAGVYYTCSSVTVESAAASIVASMALVILASIVVF